MAQLDAKKADWAGAFSVVVSSMAIATFAVATIISAFAKNTDRSGLMLAAIFLILLAIYHRLR